MALDVLKIRGDFPVLARKISGKPIIYMDSACMTLRPKQVIEAVDKYYEEFPACAGRSHHALGREASHAVDESRKKIQRFIGAKRAEEMVFTKNTTEGMNLVANSLGLKRGDVVLTSDKEHNSGLLPFLKLKDKDVAHKVFKFGDMNDFQSKLTPEVKLVSVVWTSNVDGTSQDVKEIVKIAHKNGSLVLVDGAQHVPHSETDVRALDIDFLAFSGHKMLGPSGIGVLYGKFELLEKLNPFVIGGGTVKNSTYDSYILEDIPQRFEPGLQDYAGIIGLGAAVDYLNKIGMKGIEAHEAKLNKVITDGLKDHVQLIGDPSPEKRGGVFSFNIKNVDHHILGHMLDSSSNIMTRSGMHCVHSWFNANKIPGSARVSLYVYNTEEECMKFVEEMKKIIAITA